MNAIIEKTEDFVFNLFKEKLPTNFVYHNFTHTKRVVKSVQEIIDNTPSLSEQEKEILILTCWLHDTGYIETIENHEEHSMEIAKNFLEEEDVDKNTIEQVLNCIKATNFTKSPQTLLEKIVKDADCSHFAKDYFEETSELLRQELKLQNIAEYTYQDWLDENLIVFSQKHQYYTDYAIKNWNPLKNDNYTNLLNKKIKANKRKNKEVLKARLKNESPERGIQSLYRITLRNHLKLSDIADTKANILLSVNAIIVTVIISGLGSKMDNPSNSFLLTPTVILMLFSMASIIGAILSTRPNVTSGEFDKKDVLEKKVNVLFFGNFHKMPYEDFTWAIKETIKEREDIYESLNKDLFSLGVVLNRKYKLLRITYTIFMIGIISSVIAYVFAFSSV